MTADTRNETVSESELDSIYTRLCKTMTELGEAESSLFLARFALLAVIKIDDAAAVERLIADASEKIKGAEPETASSDAPEPV
jgi:hypothetical protein